MPEISDSMYPQPPAPPDEKDYICPICRCHLTGGERLYKNQQGDIVGCQWCLEVKEAWEVLD